MAAQVFLHPTVTSNPIDIVRVEFRTGRKAYWVDSNRAELVEWNRKTEDLDFSDYVGSPEWEQPKGAA